MSTLRPTNNYHRRTRVGDGVGARVGIIFRRSSRQGARLCRSCASRVSSVDKCDVVATRGVSSRRHAGVLGQITGQLADTPTRGLPTRGLDDSRTGHLADWSTRGLDNSRTGQVANWTTRGCHRRLRVLSFPFWRPQVVQSTTCPVRELTSARVV